MRIRFPFKKYRIFQNRQTSYRHQKPVPRSTLRSTLVILRLRGTVFLLFLKKCLGPRVRGAGFHAARSGTAGRSVAPAPRETDDIFSASRARRGGHGQREPPGDAPPGRSAVNRARRGRRETRRRSKKKRSYCRLVHVIYIYIYIPRRMSTPFSRFIP